MTTLVIAQNPAVAVNIASAIGASSRREGCFEGGGFLVSWALGPLLQLAPPEVVDARWRRWSAESLPMLPARFPLVPRSVSALERLRSLRRLLQDQSTTRLVNAMESSREGELAFRHILQHLRCNKPCQRLWIDSLTPASLAEGFRALRSTAEFDNLAEAARARNEADWLVGMNVSRALRVTTGESFSMGRVQTPALAMIVARDEALRSHDPDVRDAVHALFEVSAGELEAEQPKGCDQFWATYVRTRDDSRSGRNLAARPDDNVLCVSGLIKARAEAGSGIVRSVDCRVRAVPAPELFNLTDLQQEANEQWGWSAQTTMQYAQRLHEEQKLLSLPRTDARHLTAQAAQTLGPVVAMLRPFYRALLSPKTGVEPLSARYVDASAVGTRHAIIPTSVPPTALVHRSDLAKLYDLVCRRVLSAWQADYLERVTEVVLEVAHDGIVDTYFASGTRLIEDGWRRMKSSSPVPRHTVLPGGICIGAEAQPTVVQVLSVCKPPPCLHSEATLLRAMASDLDQAVDGVHVRDRPSGLGTAATRAGIIETLVRRGYVTRERGALRSTALGKALIRAVPAELAKPALTAAWERRLHQVESGETSREAFLEEVSDVVRRTVSQVLARERRAAS